MGIYKKLLIRDGKLAGCVLVGDTADGLWYLDLIRSGASVSAMRDSIIFGRALTQDAPSALRSRASLTLDLMAAESSRSLRRPTISAFRRSRSCRERRSKPASGCAWCSAALPATETSRVIPAWSAGRANAARSPMQSAAFSSPKETGQTAPRHD